MLFQEMVMESKDKYVIVYQKSDDGPGAALHVAKTKSIRKWELNTSLA